MAAPVNPTLGALTTRVARRLGFAAQGTALTVVEPIIEDFLQSAQAQVLLDFGDFARRKVDEAGLTTADGQAFYDIPDDMDPLKLHDVAVQIGGAFDSLTEGIPSHLRSYNPSGWPQRYALRHGTTGQLQFELWPVPTAIYPILLDYTLRETDFASKTDVASVNGELLFLHALASAKAHYGQADASVPMGQYDAHKAKYRAAMHSNRRYRIIADRERGSQGEANSYEFPLPTFDNTVP